MTRPRGKKDIEPILRALEAHGLEVEVARNGHWKARKDGRVVAILPWSPSDHRALQNAKSRLRRSGYPIK